MCECVCVCARVRERENLRAAPPLAANSATPFPGDHGVGGSVVQGGERARERERERDRKRETTGYEPLRFT